MDTPPFEYEEIYAHLRECRLPKALKAVEKCASSKNDLDSLVEFLLEKQKTNLHDEKSVHTCAAFFLTLNKERQYTKLLEAYHKQLFLSGALDFLTRNRLKLLSVKNAAFFRGLFQVSIQGMGILNYVNDVESGERFFAATYLGGLEKPVVFDVGANRGSYSSLVREVSRDAVIHAFEPHPETFVTLKETAQSKGVFAFNLGMSDHEGERTLYDRTDIPGGSAHASLYRAAIEDIHQVGSEEVRIRLTTLDAFMAEHARGVTIDLLKLDTEGHELAVLQGARETIAANRINAIQFEFNEMNVVSRVFLRDFFALLPGYDFFRLLPDGAVLLPPRGAPLHLELFAFQNIVAINRAGNIRNPFLAA